MGIMRRVVLSVVAVAFFTGWGHAPAQSGRLGRILATTDDGSGLGRIVAVEPSAPWSILQEAPAPDGYTVLRAFHGSVYALGRTSGVLDAIDPESLALIERIALPPAAAYQDVAVTAGGLAYISRSDQNELLVYDFGTGQLATGPDMGPFADKDGVADLGTLLLAGDELYVQIRRLDSLGLPAQEMGGALGVVDASSGTIIDADPATPGLQAIELMGPAPVLKMHVNQGRTRLLVSARGSTNDTVGGIELVDLVSRTSEGFVVSESGENSYADLGAFVRTRRDKGYFLFHTDLTTSSHLQAFSLRTGPAPPPELYRSLGFRSESMVYHGATHTVFLADRGSDPSDPNGRPGLQVFDAENGAKLTGSSVDLGGLPIDVIAVN